MREILLRYNSTSAENVADQWDISRADQDQFAANSQKKAEMAQKNNRFVDEIAPVQIKTKRGELLVFIAHPE